jgi:hypothetical protein
MGTTIVTAGVSQVQTAVCSVIAIKSCPDTVLPVPPPRVQSHTSWLPTKQILCDATYHSCKLRDPSWCANLGTQAFSSWPEEVKEAEADGTASTKVNNFQWIGWRASCGEDGMFGGRSCGLRLQGYSGQMTCAAWGLLWLGALTCGQGHRDNVQCGGHSVNAALKCRVGPCSQGASP